MKPIGNVAQCAKNATVSTKVTVTKIRHLYLNHREPQNIRNEVMFMGWAKFDEDIREAIDERMALQRVHAQYLKRVVENNRHVQSVSVGGRRSQCEHNDKKA